MVLLCYLHISCMLAWSIWNIFYLLLSPSTRTLNFSFKHGDLSIPLCLFSSSLGCFLFLFLRNNLKFQSHILDCFYIHHPFYVSKIMEYFLLVNFLFLISIIFSPIWHPILTANQKRWLLAANFSPNSQECIKSLSMGNTRSKVLSPLVG